MTAAPRLGTVLSLSEPALAELAGAPLDFVWIDLEHAALTVRDVQTLTIAVQAAECEAHVRLPRGDSELLPAVLDAGVDGVVLPQAEDPKAVAALVARLRYPPAGTRGYGPRRAGGYGRQPTYWTSEGARARCVVQIESRAGVEAAGAIAAVEGVDALVVGCADLSFDLGEPHGLGGSALRDALGRVRVAATSAGADYGVAVGGSAGAVAALAGDAAIIVYSVDVRLYARAIDDAMAQIATALDVTTIKAPRARAAAHREATYP